MESTPTQYAGGVINQKTREGYQFLVVDQGDERRQTKFPGGTNEEYLEETIEETLRRELLEETGLDLIVGREVQILEKITDEHSKYGFLVGIDDLRGQLRTGVIIDNGIPVHPPRWVSAKTLLNTRMPQFHQELCQAACRELGIL